MLAQVHIRGRLELVSGKGKACFLKIRQRTHTIQVSLLLSRWLLLAPPRIILWHRMLSYLSSDLDNALGLTMHCVRRQAVMFVNDTTVSKGMVKYAQQLTRESIVDISGPISVPENPVEKCTQKQVPEITRAHHDLNKRPRRATCKNNVITLLCFSQAAPMCLSVNAHPR